MHAHPLHVDPHPLHVDQQRRTRAVIEILRQRADLRRARGQAVPPRSGGRSTTTTATRVHHAASRDDDRRGRPLRQLACAGPRVRAARALAGLRHRQGRRRQDHGGRGARADGGGTRQAHRRVRPRRLGPADRRVRTAGRPTRSGRALPGLWSLSVDPQEALEEWLRRQPGGAAAVAVLTRSEAFAHFVAAAPGAKEIVTIGKAIDLARQTESPDFDLVVADAPSTGHALGMLDAPRTIGEVARLARSARRPASCASSFTIRR